MPDLKITLLHPSRGRPQKAFDTGRKWREWAGLNVEYILSIDDGDEQNHIYKNGQWEELIIVSRPNASVVEATNHAARLSTGDILIYLSDDFDCPENWGLLILKEFENTKGPTLLKVDDCLQKFDVPVLTIPIMNRQLYDKLGYFWHPGYKSMFVDEDLYWTCRKIGAIKEAPHLKFPHIHPGNPDPTRRCADDETYRRSAKNWDQGKELFKQRRGAGFP